ncbi:nuclear pore complex protein Nup93-1-like [Drosophila pseudoobscura]|uniref:Nuclear pore protein n=1 Tax=Drosophila pseudoobscura pseudoobscura TaxID=46245 RepID=A0A6I8V3B7_DROPS|nr:nuclear pore complex protein Nup93-1 [Drosophila pseudoobscura]
MDLNTLLQRAQNLTNEAKAEYEMPQVERTLQQVLQATTDLHSRVTQSSNKDIQAHILLGSKGIDLPKLTQKLEALNARNTFEPVDVVGADTDVCTFLKNERENAILSVIEDTNKNISETVSKQKWVNLNSTWNEEKSRLLDALIGPSQNFIDLQRLPEHISLDPNLPISRCLSPMELIYAQELRHYNELLLKGAHRPNLVQKFAVLTSSFGDDRLTDMWSTVAAVTQVNEPVHSDPIKARQQRPEFVINAKSCLERHYKIYMCTLVGAAHSSNCYQLVRAYVTNRFSAQQAIGLVDTLDDKPLWPMVYYSLRCGAAEAAVEFLHEAGPSYEDFAQVIADRSAGAVNSRTETQLKLQYANKIKNSTDAYKKAVYCLILGCDPNELHGEVAKTIDDYLWIKLAMLRPGDAAGYGRLQSEILEKYGEKHFHASNQTDVYFKALVLVGLFEASIELLARNGQSVHAVHMAIALHELGVLGGARSVSQPLLSIDIADPQPLRRLNLTRLVRLYAQRFERTDTTEALNYYFTLRCLRDPKGRNMFLTCVCDLVVGSGALDTSIFDLIFGQRMTDADEEVPGGVFSQFDCPEFDTNTTASLIAEELVARGSFEMAVRLYELAGNYNLALKHFNILLAQVVQLSPQEGSQRARLRDEANRFSRLLAALRIDVEPKIRGSFALLQLLLVFFDLHHEGKLVQALEQLQRTQLMPNTTDDVEGCLTTIKKLSGEVIKVIPDVMVAAMDITLTQYNQLMPSGTCSSNQLQLQLEKLRVRAKALSNLAASMPFRMPYETNKRLMQLELMMH